MLTKIFAVRIGDKYNETYEKYQESKLGIINWIREEDPGIDLWWNRMKVFGSDLDCPIVIIDIDMLWINDYMKIIEFPINRGEFLTTINWWGCDQPTGIPYKFSGGFYKFYPKDTQYIFDEFYSRSEYWQNYYINRKIALPPIGGEMNFVEDCVRGRVAEKKLKIKFIPGTWNTQSSKIYQYQQDKINSKYGNDWLYKDGKYHSDIKLVHYQGYHALGEHIIPQTSLLQFSSL